jgi:formylglycine-generating enzyme required for sulfatase activity
MEKTMSRRSGLIRVLLVGMGVVALFGAGAPVRQLEPYSETIVGTVVGFDMMPVPGGTVTLTDSEAPNDERVIEVEPFWMGRTEVTWDEFDVWLLGLDTAPERRAGIDAESRPSRPYGAPDRGFGHAGFAAVSVTFHAAQRYAEWLSGKTGKRYRLPTRAEWRLACLANLEPDDVSQPGNRGGALDPAALDEQAWHGGNASRTTHAVATKEPGALGIFDLLGNAGEWASSPAGNPALHGGTYRDDPTEIHCDTRAEQQRSWNERDPQIPKSAWWLSDGPFAGFRLVRDGDG